MELNEFLLAVARGTTAILFTGACAMIVALFGVYGSKITFRAIKKADQNLDNMKKAVIKPFAVVEKKQKRAKG